MQITKDILDRYVEEGWLISQRHPTLPLTIYNYSQATQYSGKWDEVTLACRGLIVDSSTGKIVVKPFSKFFNYEEVPNDVPWSTSEYVYVQEKMDGSLGILFNYGGEWILSTRGSFTSEQAIRGMEILKSKYILDTFEPSVAYICEIIYPENRIVVNYKKEKITFLGAVINWTFTGWKESDWNELHWTTAQMYLKASGVKSKDIVKTKQIFNKELGHELYKELKSLNEANKEGYVLRFHPSNMRVKIKFDDYVKLHRVLTNCSSYDIWENLMTFNKLPEEFLNDVPDEFYQWVKEVESGLRKAYEFQLHLHMATASTILRYGGLDRKTIAERVMATTDVNHGVLFGLIDDKDVTEKLWKLVKPAYQKPFGETKSVESV